jgi:uncharacterized protein YaiE (UPF0345 family)
LVLGLCFSTLGLVVIGMAGCQGPASTATVPAVQQGPETQTAGEQDQPAASDVQVKIVKPVVGKVSGRQPQITFEKDTCDLGEVGVGAKLTGQFKFTNTGTAPLRITLVQGCCGVTTKGVEVGQEYAPGQSGALEFEYHALTMPNPAVVRVLYLQTNDPASKISTLTIKAAIVRRVDYKPEVLKLVLRRENGGCPDITLTSLDHRPFSITGFEATGNSITAAFDPNAKATEFVLKPKVDLAKLDQNMRGRVSINLTHPECNNVELMYDVLPEYTISVPSLMMFGLKPGQAVAREIWILSNYEDDFEIESVSSQKGIIKLEEKMKVNNRYQLRVEVVPPPREGGTIVVSDLLAIKIKGGKTLTIPLRGFYQDK